MIVAVAATQLEMAPFLLEAQKAGASWPTLVTGVGPLETAVRLGRFLAESPRPVNAVLQFGIGGAYLSDNPAGQPQPLAICLAKSEVQGDFGIAFPDMIQYFPEQLGGAEQFALGSPLLTRAATILTDQGISFFFGNFVTVNGISATAARGRMLRDRWQGLCENMEGAAAARICREYGMPLVEVRVVSNLVEDRNMRAWQLEQACERAGAVAALLMKELA